MKLRTAALAAPLLLAVACGASNATGASSPTMSAPSTVVVETPSPTPTETPTAGDVALGTGITITSDDESDSATVTVTAVAVHRTGTGDFVQAPAHGYYVVATVSQSTQSGSLPFNPFYFVAEVADGSTFTEEDGNGVESGYDTDQADAKTLAAGQRTSGVLVFDVPAPHGKIDYQPDSTVLGSWTY